MSVAEKSRTIQSDFSESRAAFGELSEDLKSLREDLNALRGDFTALSETAVKDARAKVNQGASAAEEQAREAIDSAASEMHELQTQVEKAVKKKPLTAVAAALAIGYFVGGLSRR